MNNSYWDPWSGQGIYQIPSCLFFSMFYLCIKEESCINDGHSTLISEFHRFLVILDKSIFSTAAFLSCSYFF